MTAASTLLMERTSIQLLEPRGTAASSNDVNAMNDSTAVVSSQTPKARLVSKVLNHLKSKKWRKRRSRPASEALSESGGQCTLSFSESDSVTSSLLEESLTIIEEERDHAQQEERSVVNQASAEESSDSMAAHAVIKQSTSSITVTSFTSSTSALRGDLDDWRKLFIPLWLFKNPFFCLDVQVQSSHLTRLSLSLHSPDSSCSVGIR
jgi:hypothetical protein